jgi:copper resistance protein D
MFIFTFLKLVNIVNIYYLISVFIHIICAAIWIGGMLFLPLVLLPSIKKHPDRIVLLYKTGVKFRFVGWICLVTLALTGFLNYYLRGLPLTWDYLAHSNYGQLLDLKLLLFIVMLTIGAVHDFYIGNKSIDEMKNTANGNFRKLAQWSGRLNLLLALAIAFIGLMLSRGGF